MVLLTLAATPAAAQPLVYGGGMFAADMGDRGAYQTLGTFPAAGGFIGLRFHEAWSIEFHVDQGFGKSPERPHIEIYGSSIVQDHAGHSRSVYVTWKSRRPGRARIAATMGISMRLFETHTLSVRNEITDYPARLGVTRTDGGAGWSGGVLVPITLAGRWSIAPEVRTTFGVSGESGGYFQFYPGVRIMWGF